MVLCESEVFPIQNANNNYDVNIYFTNSTGMFVVYAFGFKRMSEDFYDITVQAAYTDKCKILKDMEG